MATDLRSAIAELDADIAETEARLERLRLERLGAQALQDRYGDLPVTRPRRPSPSGGNGNAEFVAELLREFPEGAHLNEITALAQERGRDLDGDQVRSAVSYLRRTDRAQRLKRGTWKLVEAVVAASTLYAASQTAAGVPRITNLPAAALEQARTG